MFVLLVICSTPFLIALLLWIITLDPGHELGLDELDVTRQKPLTIVKNNPL